ncbi:cobalamin-dependent protein [Tissierella sp.]|uniref:cobalamin B12-binding domain-containing protein n=1 Tax=Tissierella sp. TaxID=41274 RepID=UPI002863995B|nr:cobalamin-dependent protein [Tissierella sp.]MDR7855553.1 cobalamin-dependent protein [Tissierella sp.]
MKDIYDKFMIFIRNEDKENALQLCLSALEEKSISVIDLYELILTPGLNSIIEEYDNDEELIWREHVRSGIIRSIIEAAYPYVLKGKSINANKEKVIVLCPEYEDHELGARMVSDFFTIAGYDSTFIGAKTPQKTILKAIEIVKPKYLCISVTNYYNLISVKKLIETIKDSIDSGISFILGGSAFISNPNTYKEIGGDLLLRNFKDIESLDRGVDKN